MAIAAGAGNFLFYLGTNSMPTHPIIRINSTIPAQPLSGKTNRKISGTKIAALSQNPVRLFITVFSDQFRVFHIPVPHTTGEPSVVARTVLLVPGRHSSPTFGARKYSHETPAATAMITTMPNIRFSFISYFP
jgi:hypothetical protein